MTEIVHDEACLRYSTARGYIFVCKMAFNSPERVSRADAVILPMHMLAAFALELHLKAWLLRAGMASKQVRKLGHDIKKLLKLSQEQGLPSVAGLEELVGIIAGPHGPDEDFTYRYINVGDQVIPLIWGAAFPIFDELDKVVDAFVGASAAHGLLPGR